MLHVTSASVYSCFWLLWFAQPSNLRNNYWTADYASTSILMAIRANMYSSASIVWVIKVTVVTVVANSHSQLTGNNRILVCTFLWSNDPLFGISICASSWAAVPIVPLQDGWTAMMYACQEGHERVVEALLKGGATVDLQAKVIRSSLDSRSSSIIPICICT